MRRTAVTLVAGLVVILGLALPAIAEGAKPAGKAPEPGTSVEMPFLIAPMSKDGKLLGYAYISSRLLCTSPSATVATREKLAFIQDANVRDVNTRSVATDDDPTKVDDVALNFRLTENARRIVGPNKVVRMIFTQIQFAPLHPSQSTIGMTASKETVDPLARAQAAQENQGSTAQAQVPSATTAKPAATSKP